MNTNQEQKLVEEAKTNASAFGDLFDIYYPKIFRYVVRRTADAELAQDITTDVFVKALDRIGSFNWRGVPFSAWLYRIASNEIANHFRSKQSKNVSLEFLEESQGFEPIADTDLETEFVQAQEEISRHEQYLAVQKQLTLLPTKYQEVIALRYFEQKSIAEISQIVGKRPGTIKSLLSRGLAKLRENAN